MPGCLVLPNTKYRMCRGPSARKHPPRTHVWDFKGAHRLPGALHGPSRESGGHWAAEDNVQGSGPHPGRRETRGSGGSGVAEGGRHTRAWCPQPS